MNDKIRKKFNATAQQAKDLLNGIKVIKPIISLIRECGEKERESVNLQVQLLLNESSLQQISAVSMLWKYNGIIESLEQKQLEENIRNRYFELKQKEEEITKEIDKLQSEINQYLFYIEESFIWVTEDTLRPILLDCVSLCDEEEFLVLLFILFNRSFDECDLMDNEELIFDSLNRDSNRSETIIKVNHNLDKLIVHIKEN